MKGMGHPDITIGHLRIAKKCSLAPEASMVERQAKVNAFAAIFGWPTNS